MGKMCRLLGLLLTGFLRYRERDGTVPELKGTGQLGVLTQSGLDTTTAQIVLQCYLIFQKRFDAGLIGLQKFTKSSSISSDNPSKLSQSPSCSATSSTPSISI